MTSTYTNSNRIEIPAKGDYLDTWATFWSNQAGVFDQMADGTGAVTVNTTKTLATANGVVTGDEARDRLLVLTGTGGTMTIPAKEKVYFIRNDCTAKVIVTCGGTTGTVYVSQRATVYCDGTNVYVLGVFENGWLAGGTTTLTGLNTTDITLPEGYKRHRLRLSSLTHAAGANRDLSAAAYEGATPFSLTAATFQTMTTATGYSGFIDISYSASGVFSTTAIATAGTGMTTLTTIVGAPSSKLDKVTIALSAAATFSAGTVVLESRP